MIVLALSAWIIGGVLFLDARHEAKGVKQPVVAAYLQYSGFPEDILGLFIKNDFLKDSHAGEIAKLSNFYNLTLWLSRETAMLEAIDKVLARCTKAAPPTAKQFEAVVGC